MRNLMAVDLANLTWDEAFVMYDDYGSKCKHGMYPFDQMFKCIEERWKKIEKKFERSLNSEHKKVILNSEEFFILFNNKRVCIYQGKKFKQISMEDWKNFEGDVLDMNIIHFLLDQTFYVDEILYQSIVELNTRLVILWQPELQNIAFGENFVKLDSVLFFSDYYGFPNNVFIELPNENSFCF